MQIITCPFFFWRWPVAFIFPASDVFFAFRAKWYIWCRWSLANSVEYRPLSCGLSWGTSFVSPTGTFLLAWHWTLVLRTVKLVPRGCLGLLLWPQLLVLLGFVCYRVLKLSNKKPPLGICPTPRSLFKYNSGGERLLIHSQSKFVQASHAPGLPRWLRR